jgi:acyl carrier protein
MGLDMLDLIFVIEHEFKIKITNEEACQADTVGKLYQCVLDKIEVSVNTRQHMKVLSKEEIWEKLTFIISDRLGVKKEDIKPESNFVKDFNV